MVALRDSSFESITIALRLQPRGVTTLPLFIEGVPKGGGSI